MSGLGKAQKEAVILQFIEFTTATPTDAQRLLKAHKYQINPAMEAFWADPVAQRNAQRAASAGNTSLGPKLDALFNQYAACASSNPDKDTWSIDATIAWCEALGVSPEDPIMLAVADTCGATEMGSFERKPWVDGWKAARVDSIEGQKSHVETLRNKLKSQAAYFRKVYNFTFDYARDKTQRGLPLEVAAEMWQILLPMAPEEMFEEDSAWCAARDKAKAELWISRWTDFLASDKGNKGRPISKDVWSQFLDFACQMDEDLEAHDPENDAWPSTLDAFAESVTANNSKPNGAMEE